MKGALSLIIPITLVYLPNTQDQKRTFLKIQCIFTLLLLEPHPSVITSDHWVINFLCWPVNFLTETDYSSGRLRKSLKRVQTPTRSFSGHQRGSLFWWMAQNAGVLNLTIELTYNVTFPLQHTNSVAQSAILTLQIISVFDNVLPPIII